MELLLCTPQIVLVVGLMVGLVGEKDGVTLGPDGLTIVGKILFICYCQPVLVAVGVIGVEVGKTDGLRDGLIVGPDGYWEGSIKIILND